MIEIRQIEDGGQIQRLIALADEIARLDGVGIAESLGVVGEDAGTIAVGGYLGGEPVGFATASAMRPPEIGLAVQPDARRQGIGRQLLEAVLAILSDHGGSEALIIAEKASPSGQAFLRRIGADYRFSEFRLERQRGLETRDTAATDLVVREATQNDRDALIAILAAAFGDSIEEAAETIDAGLAETERSFFIGSAGDQPVAVVRAGAWSGIGDITALGVIPQWQGRGYGRAMLQWAVGALEEAGHDRIALEVATDNANALRLYQSCGFTVTNEFTYSRLAISN